MDNDDEEPSLLSSNSVQILRSTKTASEMEIKHAVSSFVSGNNATETEKLKRCRELLSLCSATQEVHQAIVKETYQLLFSKAQIWKSVYETEAAAKTDLVTESIMKCVNGNQRTRGGKEAQIAKVEKQWEMDRREFDWYSMSEVYLTSLASAAMKYEFEPAVRMVVAIAMERCRATTATRGRGLTKRVTGTDWKLLSVIPDEDLRHLMDLHQFHSDDIRDFEKSLECLGFSIQRFWEASTIKTFADPSETQRPRDEQITRAIEEAENMDIDTVCIDLESDTESEQGTSSQQVHKVSPSESSADREDETNFISADVLYAARKDCTCWNVADALKRQLEQRSSKAASMQTNEQCLAMLKSILSHSRKREEKNLDHVCYAHLVLLGSHFGLQTNGLNRTRIKERLLTAFEAGGNLDTFKMDKKTSSWFRESRKSPVPSDELGYYRCKPSRSSVLRDLSPETARAVVEDLAGPDAWSTWVTDGNLIVKGLFSWIFDGVSRNDQYEPGIGDLVDEEFSMYLHHQREKNGRPKNEWLKTMTHSLTQQLICQDVVAWALYACLRPDRRQELVSYPYNAKITGASDSNSFRHIDIDFDRHLKDGQGGMAIQGAVSFDDEAANRCTEIVSGSVPIPCQRGDARITMSEMINGPTNNTDSQQQRTVFPCFVGVDSDLETLEGCYSGSWSQLATHHTKLTQPVLTPRSEGRYNTIPLRFPAATQLPLVSPISSALMCRATWDDPTVQAQANMILGSDRALAEKEISRHRLDALRMFKTRFKIMRRAEQAMFGEVSFFASK